MRIPMLVLIALLLSGPFVAALTYSRADPLKLPVTYVFDPDKHENVQITEYSYEELDDFFDNPSFRKWNDITKVCDSVEIMFGRTPSFCSSYVADVPAYRSQSMTTREYVDPSDPYYRQTDDNDRYDYSTYQSNSYDSRYDTYRTYQEPCDPPRQVVFAPVARSFYQPTYRIVTDPLYYPWAPVNRMYW